MSVSDLVLFALLGGLAGFSCYLAAFYRSRYRIMKKKAAENLSVDLELATSDQLIVELRKRNKKYVMITPAETPEPNVTSLSIEIHNLDPVTSCGMLKMSSQLMEKELVRQGLVTEEEGDGEV